MINIFPILSLLCIILFLVILYKEKFLLGFILITLLAIPSNLDPVLRIFIQISDISLLMYLFIKEYGLQFRNYPRLPRIFVYFLILYFSAMIISTIFSDYTTAGIQNISRTIVFFLIFYLLFGIIKSKNLLNVTYVSLILVGLILSISMIVILFLSGRDLSFILNPIRDRDYGIYDNINVIGMYIIELFPLVIAGLFVKSFNKKLLGIVALVMLVGVILVASRVALAAVILGSCIIFFVLDRKKFILFSTVISVLITIYTLFNPAKSQMDTILRLREGLSLHDDYWKLALNIVKEHPALGIGPGAYYYEQFNYVPVMLNTYAGEIMVRYSNMSTGSNMSHNYYLVQFTDMGILGLMSALMLPIIYFRILYSSYKKYQKPEFGKYRIILVGIFASVICMFLRGFVESIGILFYGYISIDLPFWLIFAISIYLFQKEGTEGKVKEEMTPELDKS